MNESRYFELKEKMAALKSLYASRHYSQCAKFGELLLSETHDEKHPLHLAHLNFYTALSHDTLAREATLKNRWQALSLAEQHYTAAIRALSPLQSTTPWSPTSSTSPSSPYSPRQSSLYSSPSPTSSTTSLGDVDPYYTRPMPKPRHTRFDSAVHTGLPHTPPARPETPQQAYFTANIATFVHMLEAHLASVRELSQRSGVPAVRFEMPLRRPSVRNPGRLSGDGGDEGMEAVRESRRRVVFRPRFDARSTQELCHGALAELAG